MGHLAMLYFSSLLLLIIWSLTVYCKSLHVSKSNLNGRADAFLELSKFLSQEADNEEFERYTVEEISRAITTLAKAQSAWKSMDGATHQLRNTFKTSTSLESRYTKFVSSKSKNTKEAAKLVEYITVVERGLQSCEILQSVTSTKLTKRSKLLEHAGLKEISRIQIKDKGIRCTMSILQALPTNSSDSTMVRLFAEDELIVVITDAAKNQREILQQALKLTNEKKMRKINVYQFTKSTMSPKNSTTTDLTRAERNANATELLVHPSILALASKALDLLNSELEVHDFRYPTHEIVNNTTSNVSISDSDGAKVNETIINDDVKAVKRIRVIGYSTGAAVATYLSMMLDGSMDLTSSKQQRSRLVGAFHRKVRCFLFGCPPCMSRSVVPKFVANIVCGDDVVARAQSNTMKQFSGKVLELLQSGAGKKSSWMKAPQILKEVASTAGNNLKRYKERKKSKSPLALPGRVFYIKSRELKQGATIQRILRGNWQEDILWNINDILVSEKMLDHHSLSAYIRTLARC